jgi:hypothetical protein
MHLIVFPLSFYFPNPVLKINSLSIAIIMLEDRRIGLISGHRLSSLKEF